MSVDMSQFFDVFFEESYEHLKDMEQLLLELDLTTPDIEHLNSIFRAAHSIKGGSGVFGFDALTGLTHVMENLLDLARIQQIVMNKEIVDQLLQSVDTLNGILLCYKTKEDIDWQQIDEDIAALEAVLSSAKSDSSSVNSVIAQQEEEEGFGFFEPLTEINEDEQGFGFFDDEETVKAETQRKVQHSSKAKKAETTSSSIRVDSRKVDSLLNLLGELVITQSMIKLVGKDLEGEVEEKHDHALGELSRNIRELQEAVMSMRMLPISFAFDRFPRVVRDLSHKLHKEVHLEISGGNTEIDKGLIEKIVDPLTHLIRNSIDHGIEHPKTRESCGKEKIGTIKLSAEQRGGNIVVTISDDGSGLNRQKILDKAISSGLPVSEEMSDNDVWALIFEPGFSTADTVSDVSGRGVGMDVVRRNIESIGGTVEIRSQASEGSDVIIYLPLTLAIVDGMCVSVGDEIFVIPLINIIESMQASADQIESISNDPLLRVRGEYWPVVALHKLMNINGAISSPTEAIVVLLETGRRRFALLVDSLVGQEQVVIKSLERHFKRVTGVAGATIMGDGSVAMILDIDSIANEIHTDTRQEVPVVT